jgi:hypothetical protein
LKIYAPNNLHIPFTQSSCVFMIFIKFWVQFYYLERSCFAADCLFSHISEVFSWRQILFQLGQWNIDKNKNKKEELAKKGTWIYLDLQDWDSSWGHYLTSVIPVTWEVEIGRIKISGQPG